MPTLSWDTPLPSQPCRILLNGTSGSGKTTVATRINATLGIPHVELDALYHGPGWVPRSCFVEDVRAFASTDKWVTEWQYGSVRDLLLDRADLVVWLDLPTSTVMRQVASRTLGRRLRHEELWNGNTEPPLHAFLTDRDHVVRWAWRHRHNAAQRAAEVLATQPMMPVVRLRSRREIDAWFTTLAATTDMGT